MRTAFSIIFGFVFVMIAFSQQDPTYSQPMFNQMAFNPGYAGGSDMVCFSLLTRQQWVGFEGAPSTTMLTANMPFKVFGISSGAGLTLMSDQIGFENNLSLALSYAYRQDIGNGKLGIGINLGMFNKALKPNWKIITETGDEGSPSDDPLIPENDESVIAFDLGFGLYYKMDDLYVGISTTHLNEGKLKYASTSGVSYLKRQYYLIAGYTLPFGKPLFEVTPSIFLYSDGKTSQISINTMVLYNKKFWGGVSYRAGDAITGMIGIELFNGLRIGYAYDFTTSDIRKNSNGTHEFMIGYCFNLSLDRSPQRYKSVRFL
jgi:type IX secretion system PorP/SprF family membrane protein